VGISVHNLPAVLEGDLDEIVEALIAKERTDTLGTGL
jgi:protein subunit release factor A